MPNLQLKYLDNGLSIIAEQMPVEAVTLSLWLRVGSRIESDDINGVAHFLEHMIFKGTPQLPMGEFERRLEERGGTTNAVTSQDYTHYYITTATKDFHILAPLLIELVFNPSINKTAFDREKLVVKEEISRSLDNSRRRIFRQMMEIGFEHLPYRRPVLGTIPALDNLTPDQMKKFHQSYYQPHTITAVAVGNIPVNDLISFVEETTEQLKPTMTPVCYSAIASNPEPPFTEIVKLETIDPTIEQARLILMWRVPGLHHLTKTYPLDMIAGILGQGRTSRLNQDLRENHKLVSQIGATNMTELCQGIFYITVYLPTENINKVTKIILDHIEQIQIGNLNESEIKKVQTQVANRFIFGSETPNSRANLYGYYHCMLGNLTPALTYPDEIKKINLTELQQAALEYLSTEAYGMLVVKPN